MPLSLKKRLVGNAFCVEIRYLLLFSVAFKTSCTDKTLYINRFHSMCRRIKKLCRGILEPLHSNYTLYQSFLLSVQLCRRKLKKLYTHTRIRAHTRTRTREEVQKFSCTPAQHTKTTARERNKCAGGFSSSCTIHLFSCTHRRNACKLRFYLCRRIFQQDEPTPTISATRS